MLSHSLPGLPNSSPEQSASGLPASPPVDLQLGVIQNQLETLSDPPPVGPPARVAELLGQPGAPFPTRADEDDYVRARLGVASSLFFALRCKHAETAAHCMRVALGCSDWSEALELSADERDAIEVSALLHDIGKIGLPDRILLKPSALTPEELAIVDRHRLMGVEVLAPCCGSLAVLEIVTNAIAWFDGTRLRLDAHGDDLPRGARMVAIADAYDSMTNNQVYRAAWSRERAIKELFANAGTQFDPDLVRSFHDLYGHDRAFGREDHTSRWLQTLAEATRGLPWHWNEQVIPRELAHPSELFQHKLLENMLDAVVFVDASRQIMLWNRSAEKLTGIDGATAFQRPYTPSFLRLTDERGKPLSDAECPVALALRTKSQVALRLRMQTHDRADITVDAQAIPVVSNQGIGYGVVLVIRDASGQVSLEERCQSLHQRAIRDPLTQLANRAEFDRMLVKFVAVHSERKLPCSLLITDIDRFKLVNDTYGHQTGDEVIISMAQVLKNHAGPGDLAARYGGEEFVLLCANTNNAAAAARAEAVRRAFASIPHNGTGGRALTASFGVTEIQPGDTPEAMLSRADRALLTAKETGRNKVVQLGTGSGAAPPAERQGSRWWPWRSHAATAHVDGHLVTAVPLQVAVEKLRGFIADHDAELVTIDSNRVLLHVSTEPHMRMRRSADRPNVLEIELCFAEEQIKSQVREGYDATTRRTTVKVNIQSKGSRDRRQHDLHEAARQTLASLKAYLMANDYEPQADAAVLRRATSTLIPWLMKKTDESPQR